MDWKLEVIIVPVSDVDRAKAFYTETLGFRLDADFPVRDGYRVIQVTPPGSACSIIFGDGLTPTAPGTYLGPHLIVTDLEAALKNLAARGVTVSAPFRDESGVFHHPGDAERVPGFHPERAGYGSFASFHDPDGNQWFLQEITQRAPGR
ncbi:VOC family protein [Nonomuraea sediminis]|uniref:VOC family protein n=1 Tax=Nonomuraea sediminis TaxID=2835864 RepID=UPI001BDD8641|nr:VOC family protein [Nonomuraea sediminis]